MPKRHRGGDIPTEADGANDSSSSPADQSDELKVDRLVTLIDHCTAAKAIADELGEKLLSYLLAMAIQEGRSSVRQRQRPSSGSKA
jgi:hypothetical protein